MGHAKAGWSKIDFDDNANFSTPTEITGILKGDTTITPSTPTEELGDGTDGSAGKKLAFTIMTKDINQAAFTELLVAEEALTPLWFRFYHLNGTDYYTLKSCKQYSEHMPKAAGAFHARKITGSGYAATEAAVIALTLA